MLFACFSTYFDNVHLSAYVKMIEKFEKYKECERVERIPIIQTQIRPPVIKDRFVRRAQLHKKLSSMTHYPLVLVQSGAGYGKSTALTLFIQDSGLQACWYSISPNDDDLVPFLTKLIHAIRIHHKGFGESILQELLTIHQYVQDQEIWSLVSMMVNEIEQLRDNVYIVLDDFHHIEHSLSIEQWMVHFMEHIPANCHFVLSSRNRPQWNVITSMKVKGNLLEISQEDVTFSREEMEHLLLDLYEFDLSETSLDDLHKLTEGWAIASEMVIQQLQAGINIEEVVQNKAHTLQDLFDYLAFEVLSKQSLMVQQFLMQTSILEVLSPKLCDYVLGMTGSHSMLEQLADQQLFLQRINEHHYRYHALFKSFLESRMKKEQPHEFERLHQKAARYHEQHGEMETALTHLEVTGDHGRLSQLLQEYGQEMLRSGKLQSLYDRLLAIPQNDKRHFPILWYYQGDILRYWSSYKEAESCYERAETIAKDKGDAYLMSLSLEGKAQIYLDTIQPDQAERILQKSIDLREQTNATKQEMARLYHRLAENLLNAGNAVKAEAWFERAKELKLPLLDGNLEARLYLRTGRLEQAKKVLLDRKHQYPFDQDQHLPQSFRETDILLSIISSFMGQSDEGKHYAEQGIYQGIQVQSPFVEACGWMRIGHAVQLLNRYEPHLAEQCYHTSLEMMEKMNVSRGKAEPYMGLCVLYGVQGEYEKAMAAGEKGLHETENVKDLWLSSLIQLCMGITSAYCQKYEEANAMLLTVEQQLERCGDAYGLMLTSFWKAYIAYESNEEETEVVEMRNFLERVQTSGYEFFLRKRTTFGPLDVQNIIPLLFKAQERKIHEPFVTKMIHELGYDEVTHHPGYTLRIQTLGQLKVWLGNHLIQEKDWQRGKAKELFEFLITRHQQVVPKEEIFHALWPDQDESSANRSFKVALNALLKALEPGRKARGESFFIKKEGQAYGLNPQASYELDISSFEEWVEAGLKEKDANRSKELLERGLKLYEGNYLEDRRLVDWCLNERERIQVLFLRGAEKLAQVSVRLQDFDSSIRWCEAILHVDRSWEEAYRLMMYSYYQKNNRPQAMKWYQKCLEVLDDELGVEPMQPTKEMYEIIKTSKKVEVFSS